MNQLHFLAAASLLALVGCGTQRDEADSAEQKTATAAQSSSVADSMASRDGAAGEAEDQPRSVMQLQVVLDRLGFSPGVVTGEMGQSTVNALKGFQKANAIGVTGTLDQATQAKLTRYDTVPATRMVTVPEDYAALRFVPIPDKTEAQAELEKLGYGDLWEKLAERFHTTPRVLQALNAVRTPATAAATDAKGGDGGGAVTQPPANGTVAAAPAPSPLPVPVAGQRLRVPNVGADAIARGSVKDEKWRATLVSLGVGSSQPTAERVVVDKSDGVLRVFDAEDTLIAQFTATMGSSRDPLPIGTWTIKGTAYNPPFHYNPELFWDVSDSKDKLTLPPGPNSPVGVVWIDLSKEHYGIHGTPEPQTIGTAESHGCIRLTNWDAARLAQMVSPGLKAVFQE